MPIVYEVVPNESNIYFSRAKNPFNPAEDSHDALTQLSNILSTTEGKLYIISDVREIDPSFSEVVIGMAEAAADPNSPVRNERVEIVTLATGALLKLVVEWMKQSQYGSIQQSLFETEEDALEHVRKLRAQSTK
jgi:hypothetical protein